MESNNLILLLIGIIVFILGIFLIILFWSDFVNLVKGIVGSLLVLVGLVITILEITSK